MKTTLEKANDLHREIKELKHFLFIVTKYDEKTDGIPSVNAIMKKQVKVEISVLGSRFFGTGTHEQNIKIPDSVRNELIKLVGRRKRALEKELKALFIQSEA